MFTIIVSPSTTRITSADTVTEEEEEGELGGAERKTDGYNVSNAQKNNALLSTLNGVGFFLPKECI